MWLWRLVGALHRGVYRGSGGRLGARMAGLDMLLLTTTGRKSGQERVQPLSYMADGRDLVIVASNGGSDAHPAWWLNLEALPQARVRAGREDFEVRAILASSEARERLWPLLTEYNPPYASYQLKTERELPVIILRRIGSV